MENIKEKFEFEVISEYEGMRLDKYLVACAIGSRTEVKNFLKAGRVTVNGKKENL